jgi:hypothetical protein
MSQLNIDTIQNRSGGPVTLTKQSAAKAWVKYDQATTTAIDVSFGVSGITDEGTGDATTAFTNSFSSADFAHSGFAKENGLINWKSSAAGNIRCVTIQTNAVNADYDEVAIILFGDLA